MEQDLKSITETFEITVREQEKELLAQAWRLSSTLLRRTAGGRALGLGMRPQELNRKAFQRPVRTLTESLSRRVAFWEERRPKEVLKAVLIIDNKTNNNSNNNNKTKNNNTHTQQVLRFDLLNYRLQVDDGRQFPCSKLSDLSTLSLGDR